MRRVATSLAALISLTAFGLMAFCLADASAQPRDLLIVPGRQVGRIPLGPNGDRIIASLPTMDFAEQIWARPEEHGFLWMSPPPHDLPSLQVKYKTLYVHTTANSLLHVKPLDGSTIDLIRVTSPRLPLKMACILAAHWRRYCGATRTLALAIADSFFTMTNVPELLSSLPIHLRRLPTRLPS